MLVVGIRCICAPNATGSCTSCGSNTASSRRLLAVWRSLTLCLLLSGRCSELKRRTFSFAIFQMSLCVCQVIFPLSAFKTKVSGQKMAAAQDNQKGCFLFNFIFSSFLLCIQKLITVKWVGKKAHADVCFLYSLSCLHD